MLDLVVNHLWQSTVFALAIALVMPLFRDNGAHVRHALWFAAMLKFLLPLSAFSYLGRALAPEAGLPVAFDNVIYASVGRLVEPVSAVAPETPYALLVLAGLWAAGMASLIGLWSHRAFRMWRVASRARPAPRRVQAAVPGLPVLYARSSMEPGIFGIFRPVLLLPEGIDERLTAQQMRAIFGHELAHWHRRDNLTAVVSMLVQALFWFHPLVWWMGRRQQEEQEKACDEAVVRAGHSPDDYAEGILNVCHFFVASRLACAPGVSGADLKARITAIMKETKVMKLHAFQKALLATVATVVIAGPVLMGMGAATSLPALAQQASVEHVAQRPITAVPPRYPQEAMDKGLEGHVVLKFDIGKDGKPRDVEVLTSEITAGKAEDQSSDEANADVSEDIFDKAATEALEQFEFEPVERDGRKIVLEDQQFKFEFRLEKDQKGSFDPQAVRREFEAAEAGLPVELRERLARIESLSEEEREKLQQEMAAATLEMEEASRALAEARHKLAEVHQKMAMAGMDQANGQMFSRHIIREFSPEERAEFELRMQHIRERMQDFEKHWRPAVPVAPAAPSAPPAPPAPAK